MPRVDPLEEISIAPAPGSPAAAAATAGLNDGALTRSSVDGKRRELRDKARAFVTSDMLLTSPVQGLSITEVHRHADLHGIADPDHELGETDLRRMLVYCDALRVQRGERPLAVAKVEHTPPPELAAAKLAEAGRVKSLPLSPSGEWRVTHAHRGIAMAGGIYPMQVGTIVRAVDHRPDVLESFAKQGLQLEPWPPIPRESCPDCGTSYLTTMARACPLCSVRDILDAAGREVQETHERAAREVQDVNARAAQVEQVALEQAERADQLGATLKAQHARHQALARWAVAQGAREPDGDEGTTWQGEPHPPPLAHVLAARNPDAAPPTVPEVAPADGEPATEPATTGRRKPR